MKQTSWIYSWFKIFLFGAVLIGAGCASTEPRPEPVTVQKILDMTRAGLSSEEIIAEIRSSGTVYRLDEARLTDLKGRGVPDDVLNYMQKTYQEEKSRLNGRSMTPAGPGLLYGGKPSDWPYAR